jgi:CDGSH-type Zn-finger protein
VIVANIKVRMNGPYLVEGDDVTLVDWNGNAYQIPKRPFALCRCGGSTNKPFCDGTHSRAGFQAAEAAVGLGIILAFYRNKETVNIDEMNLMRW